MTLFEKMLRVLAVVALTAGLSACQTDDSAGAMVDQATAAADLPGFLTLPLSLDEIGL